MLTPAPGQKPLQRWIAQEQAIIAALKAAGYDPKALPPTPDGRHGVKYAMRCALVGRNGLFPEGAATFDKAWLRLRKQRDILNATDQCARRSSLAV